MGAFNSTQTARIAKTVRLFEQRPEFMRDLVKAVQAKIRKAARENMVPAFRLNLTSDVRWECIPVTVAGEWFPNVMTAFPTVQFYDYTAHTNRRNLPPNYHLTFSRKETHTLEFCLSLIDSGTNVAVVFDTPKGVPLPTEFMGRPVIDGRTHDLRFTDPKGVWVGLSALGRGKKDESGFVVKVK
jgi:hypothetical protein